MGRGIWAYQTWTYQDEIIGVLRRACINALLHVDEVKYVRHYRSRYIDILHTFKYSSYLKFIVYS